ncbi:MAG: methyltransferase domain-containing protein [Gemmataceae bacterium]
MTADPLDTLLPLLQCVGGGPDPADRCPGGLARTADGLQCQACGTAYPTRAGVPVMRDIADDRKDATLEGVYNEESDRTAALAGGPWRDQAEPYWSVIRGLVADHRVTGPSLEVGCGLGLLADTAPEYVGLDYSPYAVTARGFEGYMRVAGDAQVLPFRDGVFGLVFTINCLEHVPDAARALAEIDRVMRPGGHLLLKPAWNCTRYNTEGLPLRPYRELTLRQKAVKFLLPVLRSKPYKVATRVPWRAYRRLVGRGELVYGRLTPSFDYLCQLSDSDAFSSLDPHECMRHFRHRGYTVLSHAGAARQVLAGHDVVILRKPG